MVVTLNTPAVKQAGITYPQALEIWERFHTNGQTVQTVAEKMRVSETAVMDCLDGKIWPAVRRYWYDNAKPIPEFLQRAQAQKEQSK